MKAALRTDDLGVGIRPGRRSTATLKKRLRLGLCRASRDSILRQAAGALAGKLFATGVRLQATYGHMCVGLASRQRATILRAAKKVAGPGGLAPCGYCLVFLRLGILPTVQVQKDQIKLWLQLWKRSEDRSGLTKAWRVFRDQLVELPEPKAWEKTIGPIGATIMVLRAAGWQPLQPDRWNAPQDRCAILNAKEPHADGDILEAVSLDLEKQMWKEASKHFMGSGLEQGIPCFEPAKIARRKLVYLSNKQKADGASASSAGAPAAEPDELAIFLRIAALDADNAGGATGGRRYRRHGRVLGAELRRRQPDTDTSIASPTHHRS